MVTLAAQYLKPELFSRCPRGHSSPWGVNLHHPSLGTALALLPLESLAQSFYSSFCCLGVRSCNVAHRVGGVQSWRAGGKWRTLRNAGAPVWHSQGSHMVQHGVGAGLGGVGCPCGVAPGPSEVGQPSSNHNLNTNLGPDMGVMPPTDSLFPAMLLLVPWRLP